MTDHPKTIAGVALAATCVLVASAVIAQDNEGPGPFTLQCEVYCSSEKLRTANARLSWADPRMRLIREANSLDTADRDLGEEIETTVFKDGFEENLYASFPTKLEARELAPRLAPETADANLRAYQLLLTGVSRPAIEGRSIEALLGGSPQDVETSAVIEGLEPGLTYYWRVRVQMPDGVEISQSVACVAPVCPADLQEGDAQ